MRKKIGILGGTLDPIHNGHLIIAQTALEQFDLEKILIMPTGNPPHKSINNIEDINHRASMIKLAISDNPKFIFSDFELKRTGTIYTSDTLQQLNNLYKDVDFYFIMGADSLINIETWHCPEKIFELATILVADRITDKEKNDALLKYIKYLNKKYLCNIMVLDVPIIEISSSEIREKIKYGKSIRYYLPEEERKYITENKLYLK